MEQIPHFDCLEKLISYEAGYYATNKIHRCQETYEARNENENDMYGKRQR
jgi:hypothetical protein